jgi:putative colanic acid biosynthesis UDP-glucose lipid carrier transferase
MFRDPLKEHAMLLDWISRLIDPVFALVCIQLLGNYFHLLQPPIFVKVFSIYVPILVLVIFPVFQLYKSWRGISINYEMKQVFLAWTTSLLAFHMLSFLLFNKTEFAILWPLGIFKAWPVLVSSLIVLIVLMSYRIILRVLLRYARTRGYNLRTACVVGAGEIGRRLQRIVSEKPWMGYSVEAFFDDDKGKHKNTIDGVPIYGSIDELPDYLSKKNIDVVFLALPLRAEGRMSQVLGSLEAFTGDVIMIPDIFSYSLLNCSLSELAGLPVINLRRALGGVGLLLKQCEDYVLSSLGIIIFALPMCVIALAIKLSSPGPIIFRQRRYGLNGREIIVYKFRTMTVCEDGPLIPQATKCDPRVTKVGAFLRKYNLDELPQFMNVLQGRLSIVGPRPHAVAHNEFYGKQVWYYMLRHKLKPGITGWAQVNGWRGETETIDKMEMRVKYDLEYIGKWSLWFDIKILLLTLIRGFNQSTAY